MKILIRNLQRRRSLNKGRILATAGKVLTLMQRPEAELSILFVGDRRMKQLNTEYRGIRKTTDVLSFEAGMPFGQDDVIGDVVISVPKAELQAETFGWDLYEEIDRLLVHGILHLLGYDHVGSEYRARKMRKKEGELLDAVKKMD